MNKSRKAKGNPLLLFTMGLDSNRHVIPGLNRGRLALFDDEGLIQRWVATSSYDKLQGIDDWNERGGIMPPTSAMPGMKYWEFHTRRLIRPGMEVDDGFLITFDGATSYVTNTGARRSELMVHDDTNRTTNPGSFGCPVTMSKTEWDDFCRVILQSVSHLSAINMAVTYSW